MVNVLNAMFAKRINRIQIITIILPAKYNRYFRVHTCKICSAKIINNFLILISSIKK